MSTDAMAQVIKGYGEYEIEASVRAQSEIKKKELLKKKSNTLRNMKPSLLVLIAHTRGQSRRQERKRSHHG